MTNNFKSLALTYKTAPLLIREQVSLPEGSAKELLRFLGTSTGGTDFLVVSTCNRTEVYYNSTKDLTAEILRGLTLIKGIDNDISKYFAKYEGSAAIRHLFEVAIGLDAQVLGDLQISGQVKNAYQWTADENMAGPFLHRLMHTIFFCNKRVVQETAFRDGAASISYAAKEMAEDLAAGVPSPKVLVVGVGEIGQDVCLNLINSKFKNVTILNRTLVKAEKLAVKCGFSFNTIDKLKAEIEDADVIFSSVSGTEPLITKDLFSGARFFTHKYFIDLSIPRSIEPEVDEISGAVVFNLDDIQEKTNEAVEKRKASIPHVLQIIEEAMEEFEDWSKEMVVSPTIQRLKNALEQIRKEELSRYVKNAKPEEAEKLDEMSKSLMQKILKYPVLHLKAACRRGDAGSLAEILQDLFNLEQTSERPRKP